MSFAMAAFLKECPPRRAFILGVKFFILAELLAVSLSLLTRYFFNFFDIELSQQAATMQLSNPDAPITDIVFIVLSSIFVSPLLEELFFRYCLLNWLVSKTNKAGLSIILVSFLFAICHYNATVALPLFGVSVAFSLAFLKTQSLLVPILAHTFYNLTAVLVALSARL